MLQNLRKRQEGFTIIEVMIVLVIAAVILLIVFLAVPALQRNSRNTQAKNEAAQLSSAVAEFTANNGGTAPANSATAGTYAVKGGSGTGDDQKIINLTNNKTVTKLLIEAKTATSRPPDVNSAIVRVGATCNGFTSTATTATTASAASSRQYVTIYMIESPAATPTCVESGL